MPVILYVGKDGCGACAKWENQAWNPALADRGLTERFAFRVSKRIEPAWDRHVAGFPTILAIDTNTWNLWFSSEVHRKDPIPAIKYSGAVDIGSFRSWLFGLHIV
jgi:hypothetical protein